MIDQQTIGVRLRGVDKAYGDIGSRAVLAGLSLDVAPGEALAVVGRSGAGKSTLLHLLAGLDQPTAGTVNVGGVDVHELTPSRSARWRARHVGIVFQFFQLLPTLNLLENVMLPMELASYVPPGGRTRRATDLLEWLGLGEQASRLPADVSGGEQQRAALARAIANDPPLLLADEPTGNLDATSARAVEDVLLGHARTGRTLVLVTHDRTLAARADRCLELVGGRQ